MLAIFPFLHSMRFTAKPAKREKIRSDILLRKSEAKNLSFVIFIMFKLFGIPLIRDKFNIFISKKFYFIALQIKNDAHAFLARTFLFSRTQRTFIPLDSLNH